MCRSLHVQCYFVTLLYTESLPVNKMHATQCNIFPITIMDTARICSLLHPLPYKAIVACLCHLCWPAQKLKCHSSLTLPSTNTLQLPGS